MMLPIMGVNEMTPRICNIDVRPGIAFIGMETSGQLRRRLQALGFETYSADTLPSEDGGEEMTLDRGGVAVGPASCRRRV